MIPYIIKAAKVVFYLVFMRYVEGHGPLIIWQDILSGLVALFQERILYIPAGESTDSLSMVVFASKEQMS